MKKRVLTVCAALVLAVALGVLAYAADGNLYSVSVSGKNISFVSGGRVVGTYQASSTDLKLMTDGEGGLLPRNGRSLSWRDAWKADVGNDSGRYVVSDS